MHTKPTILFLKILSMWLEKSLCLRARTVLGEDMELSSLNLQRPGSPALEDIMPLSDLHGCCTHVAQTHIQVQIHTPQTSYKNVL